MRSALRITIALIPMHLSPQPHTSLACICPRRMLVARFLVVSLLLLSPLALAGDAQDLLNPSERSRLSALERLSKTKVVDPALTAILVDRMREDPSPAVRQASARALARVQPTQKLALAALVAVATDPEEVMGVRRTAVYSLGQLGKKSRKVAAVLERVAEDYRLTGEAIRGLSAIGFPEKGKPFLSHRDERVRSIATDTYLGTGGSDSLVFALSTKDPEIRRKAVSGLQNRNYQVTPLSQQEIDALVKAAGDDDPQVRAAIALGLKAAGKSSLVVPLLIEGLKSEHDEVRWTSAEALSVAGPAVVDHLAAIAKAIDEAQIERIRMALILALGEAGEKAKPILPRLFSLLKNPSKAIRVTALRALTKAGAADPAETLKQVKPLANDSDCKQLASTIVASLGSTPDDLAVALRNPDIREAMKSLPGVKKLGPKALPFVDDLLAMATGMPKPRPNFALPDLNGPIAEAIVAIGPKALPAVVKGMKSKDVRVRNLCARTLKEFGPDATPALAALRKGVLDPERSVRAVCGQALGALGYRAREAAPELILSLKKYPDTAYAAGDALAWIGTTGEDAKAVLALAKDPQPQQSLPGRLQAAAGAGKEAQALFDEIKPTLPPRSPAHRILPELRSLADREKYIAIKLVTLENPTLDTPASLATRLLRLELSVDQKKKVVQALIGVLETRKPPHQIEVLRMLHWAGPEAAAALPAVEKLTSSPDEAVQRTAKEALERLRADRSSD